MGYSAIKQPVPKPALYQITNLPRCSGAEIRLVSSLSSCSAERREPTHRAQAYTHFNTFETFCDKDCTVLQFAIDFRWKNAAKRR